MASQHLPGNDLLGSWPRSCQGGNRLLTVNLSLGILQIPIHKDSSQDHAYGLSKFNHSHSSGQGAQ